MALNNKKQDSLLTTVSGLLWNDRGIVKIG